MSTRVSPIVPLAVGRNGAYAHVRSSSAQGSCGVRGYPCKHPGVDLVGRYGTEVRAPEDGVVVSVADGSGAPFGGYGPWLIVIQGASGKFHLLAHLDPARKHEAPLLSRVSAGDRIGATSAANHVHWEVRDKITPPTGNNFDNNSDPLAWLSGGGGILLPMIAAGGVVLLWLWGRR